MNLLAPPLHGAHVRQLNCTPQSMLKLLVATRNARRKLIASWRSLVGTRRLRRSNLSSAALCRLCRLCNRALRYLLRSSRRIVDSLTLLLFVAKRATHRRVSTLETKKKKKKHAQNDLLCPSCSSVVCQCRVYARWRSLFVRRKRGLFL
jgi:hypothetical protein